MPPARLGDCLVVVRWSPDILAEAIDVPSEVVAAWLAGAVVVPAKVGAWIEALCFVHEVAEAAKPVTAGVGYDKGRREFIPVYAYNLLRNLHQSPVLLRSLFGGDDEGAVFFLVSRGLAIRESEQLTITEEGRSVGAMYI